MGRSKPEPPTTFLELHRAPPESEPPPPHPPVFGEPGFLPPRPEPLPREAPASLHLGRFAADPATAWRRRRSTPECQGRLLLVLAALLFASLVLGLVLWLRG